MKIAYIITRSDSIGGAQRHLLDLSKGQQQFQNEVIVLVGGDGPFVEELTRNQIEVIPVKELRRSINPLRDIQAFITIRRILKSIKPDLVSAHSSKAGLLGRLVCRNLNIPVIFTVHGWAFSGGSSLPARCLYWFAETVMGLLSTKIITVSDYDYQLGLKWALVPPRKSIRVHNGIPDVDESLRANPAAQPVNIISVARFESPKDHALLIEALKGLKNTEVPWCLHLVGDGPDKPRIERLVEASGLSEKVKFWGYRADAEAILAKSQLFVLSSKKEGLPLTILEAMRAGLPVIASDVA